MCPKMQCVLLIQDELKSVFLLPKSFFLLFKGLYAHCGNSYIGTNPEEIQKLRDNNVIKLNDVARLLMQNGIPVKNRGSILLLKFIRNKYIDEHHLRNK